MVSGFARLWARALPAYGLGLRPPMVSGFARLWSRALPAYGLPYLKFYDDLFYIDYKYKGPRRKERVPQNIH